MSFLLNRESDTFHLTSRSNSKVQCKNNSRAVSLSDNGRFAVFTSIANTLGKPYPTQNYYVYDRDTDQIQPAFPSDGPYRFLQLYDGKISNEGRYLTFSGLKIARTERANRRRSVFIYDRQTGEVVDVDLTERSHE